MEIKPKDFNSVNFKFFRTIIFIFERIFVVVSSILAVTLAVVTFIPKKLFEINGEGLRNFDLELGNVITLNLDLSELQSFNVKAYALTMIFVALILLVVVMLITKNLRLIFDTLVDKNPFHENNSKKITQIGILLIVLSIISGLPEFISYSMMTKVVDLEYITIKYSIDNGLLFSGILVIILATIFKYGTFLQNEYNQTL